MTERTNIHTPTPGVVEHCGYMRGRKKLKILADERKRKKRSNRAEEHSSLFSLLLFLGILAYQ
jgi:hypothetical protein